MRIDHDALIGIPVTIVIAGQFFRALGWLPK